MASFKDFSALQQLVAAVGALIPVIGGVIVALTYVFVPRSTYDIAAAQVVTLNNTVVTLQQQIEANRTDLEQTVSESRFKMFVYEKSIQDGEEKVRALARLKESQGELTPDQQSDLEVTTSRLSRWKTNLDELKQGGL